MYREPGELGKELAHEDARAVCEDRRWVGGEEAR